MTFLTSSPPLARALRDRDYVQATPVQTAVLQDEAAGRDLLVSAQTGSGKTVAYGLAIASTLLDDSERFQNAAAPLALIVAPTRELALQVHRELSWLYAHAGARVVSCVGGMDPRREQRALADGAHIVVGTPGRLCDHIKRNRLNVTELKAVVLDEADEMLDLGFREDLQFILEATPAERRTLLFSATLPRGIVALARQFQRQAFRIEVTEGEGGHDDIEYRVIRVNAHETEHAVVNVLRFTESPSALVFCNTRNAVNHLQGALLERGFSVVSLSGELSQNERNIALQALRDGRARVCVATDVAARGIDLPNLGLVIHAELPNDAETLQHRSGRTGRAGRKGISVLLVPPARRRRAELLLDSAGIDANWTSAPSADDIRKLDNERLLGDPLLTEEATEDDLAMGRALLEKRSAEDIAAAFVRLYCSRLPSPEDVSDPDQDRNPRDGQRSKKKSAPRAGASGQHVWFRLSIGREKNAEARWLLPMICRRGRITRDDIGAIRIFTDSTEFEVADHVAERFAGSIQRPGGKDDNIHIAPLIGEPQSYDKKRERPHPNSHTRKAERALKHERNDRSEPRSKPKRPKRAKK